MARTSSSVSTWIRAFELGAALVGLMGLVIVLEWLSPTDLRLFGILPRTGSGLLGILFAPLLHASVTHYLANALPLLVLLVLLFAQSKYRPEATLGWIWIGSGLGTWLIGRGHAVHLGASSLIYGLIVYLITAGWWMRSWRAVLVALVVLVLYGGAWYGVLPHPGTVSWEGHLAGAIAGFAVARYHHA